MTNALPARTFPKWTAAVALAALFCQLVPQAAGWFEFDRPREAAGQVWRLLTGPLDAFHGGHFALDAAASYAGACCERRARRFPVAAGRVRLSISPPLDGAAGAADVTGLIRLESALSSSRRLGKLADPRRTAAVPAAAIGALAAGFAF